MASVPSSPKIYHITHIDNLPNIAANMGLVSDATRIARNISCSVVGMSTIKERRLKEIEVPCHPKTMVGQYVPFYFCPRSIMLFMLHMGNHPDISYKGGQQPIVHLQADFHKVINWANSNSVSWAWTLIEKIGIINSTMATKVKATLANVAHKPVIAVEPNWYF